MNRAFFVSPFINPAIDALKIAALYFDEIVIPKSALVQVESVEKKEQDIRGLLKEKIWLPDEDFCRVIQPLVDQDVVSVTWPLSDNLHNQQPWEKVSQGVVALLGQDPQLFLPDYDFKSGQLSSSDGFRVPWEVSHILQRYMQHSGLERAVVLQPQFVLAYYAILLSAMYMGFVAGGIPLTSSPLLKALSHQLFKTKAFAEFQSELSRMDALVPYVAQNVLSFAVPDVSWLDFDDIMEIREKLREELEPFREELSRLTYDAVTQTRELRDTDDIDAMINFRIKPKIEAFEKRARQSTSRVLKSFIKAIKSPATYVPLIGSLFKQIPTQVAFFLSLGLVSVETAAEYVKERKEIAKDGLSYLIDIQQLARAKSHSVRQYLGPVALEDAQSTNFWPFIPNLLEK